MNATVASAPIVSSGVIIVVVILCLAVLVSAKFRAGRAFYWRALLFAAIAVIFINPVALHEERSPLRDKLLIVVDGSDSQKIAGRDAVAEKALQSLQERIKVDGTIDPVIVRVPPSSDGTELFKAVRDAIAGIPAQQAAGTVLITDGQVHDVPETLGVLDALSPFHVVLTGKKDEFDRKVTIVSAPKYGLLNETVRISVKVEETGKAEASLVNLRVLQDGKSVMEETVTTGTERNFSFRLNHPGQNVFEFNVDAVAGELTESNNTAPVIINGIRDRLKVLLVSGAPHMGERAWRNLLKSDPGIDLVHFTILRSPAAMDPTPQHEMSLIAFPVEELFAVKIDEFDLIIFDKYQQYGLMMPYYFTNMENFVRKGGAFLLAMGSGDPEQFIYTTALGNILPVAPRLGAESIVRQSFRPALTEDGLHHPVTADLQKLYAKKQWGEWHTSTDINALRGTTLMNGVASNPLLVLDKVDEGRVAVLASDNIWLWSKGGNSTGPYMDLLRNLAHWLMKEPELEEDFIKAEAKGRSITVAMRDIGSEQKRVDMTDPSGQTETLALTDKIEGWIRTKIEVEQDGIYSFSNGNKKAFVVVGTALSPEFSDVRTTEAKLAPIVHKSGGGIVWYQENPDFDLRNVSPSSSKKGGEDWLGLKRNEAFAVLRVDTQVVFNNWMILLIILAFSLWAWWCESGRKRNRS